MRAYEYSIGDSQRGINNETAGRILADVLQRLCEDDRLPQVRGPYVGLAAGWGLAEMAFAKKFEIPIENITLVDRFKDDVPEGMSDDQYVVEDLFDFLDSTSSKYSLVSLFGSEMILNDKNDENLWKGLERVVQRGGYVIVFPVFRKMKVPNTFRILSESDSNHVIALRK